MQYLTASQPWSVKRCGTERKCESRSKTGRRRERRDEEQGEEVKGASEQGKQVCTFKRGSKANSKIQIQSKRDCLSIHISTVAPKRDSCVLYNLKSRNTPMHINYWFKM